MHDTLAAKVTHLLARLGARRGTVVAVLAVMTIGFAAGVRRLRVETGVLDWLPQHHPNVQAFSALFEKLPGTVNQELLWLELDPAKAGAAGVRSITDPASFYAQEELVAYVRARVPELRGEFGLLPLLGMVGAANPFGARSAGALPRDPEQVRVLWDFVEKTTAGKLVRPFIATEGQGTILALLVDAPPLSSEARAAGRKLVRALDEYRVDPTRRYDLFRGEYLVPAGLSSGSAGMDAAIQRDLLRLTPPALLFLAVVLFLVLGSLRTLALLASILLVGLVWTLGLMGWCGTPLSVVTVALVPLIIGCGIDAAILIAIEARDRRAGGRSPHQVLAELVPSSITAVLLTMLTTAAGLLMLVLSDSPGMRGLGYHAAFGMVILGLLAIVLVSCFMPPGGDRALPWIGATIARAAELTTRKRAFMLVVWLLVTAGSVVLVRTPVVSVDLLEGNYPAEAPISRAARRMRAACGGAFPELVIVRGDVTTRRAIEIMEGIERRLVAGALAGSGVQVVGLPQIVGMAQSLTLTPWRGAADPRAALKELFENPRWERFASLFVDREGTIGLVMLLGADTANDLPAAAALWGALEAAIAAETRPGDPVSVSFLGYRTMSYLFTTYSWRWIKVVAAASLAVVTALAALFLRRGRAVLVVALLMGGSSVWWLGTLQIAGIYLSVFLLFPLAFAMCIGSDYGLHLLCGLGSPPLGAGQSPRDHAHQVWGTTGRAIALAAFTDAGVFLIFSRMELVSGSQIMLAVALAVAAVFATTVVLVPALAGPGRAGPPPPVPPDPGAG